MAKVSHVPHKNIAELTEQWDQLAVERDRQLSTSTDLSFKYIVAPTALRLLNAADKFVLLDIGCGTGHFTSLVSECSGTVIGVEPSPVSAEIARRVCSQRTNVQIHESTVENFAASASNIHATAAVSLMVLMTTPDLKLFAKSVGSLLPSGAAFVAVICHPCFWPGYKGYADATWFDYTKETFIESPFVISNSSTNIVTTYIHRSITQYISTFNDFGFQLDVVEEPVPTADVERLYPESWAFPRFLAYRWIKK